MDNGERSLHAELLQNVGDAEPERWTGRAQVNSTPAGPSRDEPPAYRATAQPVSPSRPPAVPVYKTKRMRPRWGRIALISFLALVLLAGLTGLGAFLWIILTFVYFRYTGGGAIGVACALLYFVACYFLVRKVHADLGKVDIR